MIRVLVVDDSAFMRRLLTDLLESSGQIQVVGTARNGADAIEKNLRLTPDVITLDVEMPLMDGLTALTKIMEARAVPVVMLSSLTQAGAAVTLEALAKGAVDFIGKPDSPLQIQDPELRSALIDKIVLAAAVDLGKLKPVAQPRLVRPVAHSISGKLSLAAIGTSTGGPRALQQVVPNLPVNGRTAYLIVQHMPKGFTKSLAERLDNMSPLSVQEAVDQQVIKPDHVYVAPGDQHLSVEIIQGQPHIKLLQTANVNGHRPSVDVLFQSLARFPGLCRVGVIMTGMGADGAKGLLELKNAGAYTIAEDASSAVIYGMPKAAVQLGAANRSVPLPEIADAISLGLIGGKES